MNAAAGFHLFDLMNIFSTAGIPGEPGRRLFETDIVSGRNWIRCFKNKWTLNILVGSKNGNLPSFSNFKKYETGTEYYP